MLCRDGLATHVEVIRAALAIDDDEAAFLHFMRGIVDADVHSLTQRLNRRLLRRAKAANVVRADLQVDDLSMLFEQLTAIRIGDAERTRALRHRYLALHLDALRPAAAHATKLPGPAPRDEELHERWTYKNVR